MASPAAQPPQKGAPVGLRTLDCQSCFEPFSSVIGPRYPRILAPCAHTFCTECITNQLKARGPDDFRCLTHDQPIQINKAEDVKANFALIELLELIEKDADHQVVDERTKPPSCSECDEPSVWYCKNDEACFCDSHKISCHSSKAQSTHTIMPVAERTVALPKCSTHKSKELDLWCIQCSVLCCIMCERSGAHKDHVDKLHPVDDVVLAQRTKIVSCRSSADALTAGALEKEAQSLIALQSDFEASARRVHEEITKQEAEMMRALEERFTALRKDAQAQLAAGLKHIALRVDNLTMSRSRAAMVSEEASRVLRMSDHALLAHTPSVEQHATRAHKDWGEYQSQLYSVQLQNMQLTFAPQLLLNEIAVAGLVQPSCVALGSFRRRPPSAQLPLSVHRVEERSQLERELASLRRGLAEATARQKQLDQTVAAAGSSAKQTVAELEAALKSVCCMQCRASYLTASAKCVASSNPYEQVYNNPAPHRWASLQLEPLSQLLERCKKREQQIR